LPFAFCLLPFAFIERPKNEKTRRPDKAGGFRKLVRVYSDHARTQTTSLQGRLTRLRPVVLVVRSIERAV
jgi:hypothetical protein